MQKFHFHESLFQLDHPDVIHPEPLLLASFCASPRGVAASISALFQLDPDCQASVDHLPLPQPPASQPFRAVSKYGVGEGFAGGITASALTDSGAGSTLGSAGVMTIEELGFFQDVSFKSWLV